MPDRPSPPVCDGNRGAPRQGAEPPRALSEAHFLSGRHPKDKRVRAGNRGAQPSGALPLGKLVLLLAEIKLSPETIMSTEVPQHLLPPSRSEVTARRREELRRIAEEGSGELAFVSSDRAVAFTFEEMAALHEWCPAIINMRRMMYVACRGWLQRIPMEKRKSVLVQWLLETGESMSPPKPKLRRSFEASVRRYLRQGDEQNWQEIVNRHYEQWERGRGRKSRGPT
jgi:hypothetical protein